MTYQETLDWMFQQLPMYQRQGKSAYKKDLSNTIKLVDHLDNPHNKFKSIHVAGTNGKGSTSHMLASIMQEAGYNVGLYTSPHLKDFRERIKLNGKPVSKQFVIQFIKQNKSFLEMNSLSFFEMTVGMAFEYFAKKEVDIVIIEVGLGGRLDSTNIIKPEVSIITNIGLDHTQFLGTSIEEIALEKAGIIKENIPVVVSETQNEIKDIFERVANESNSECYFADQLIIENYETDLLGDYQQKNSKGVLQSLKLLTDFSITTNDIKAGLLNTIKSTGLLGRWQVLGQKPKVICDAAHNKEGLTIVLNQLSNEKYDNLHIVLGFVSDKDLNTVLSLFPKEANYYFAKPNIQRGLDSDKLKSVSLKYNLIGNAYPSVKDAYTNAIKNAAKNDVVYVGGSTFVVAEII